jgi:hypothetical protein
VSSLALFGVAAYAPSVIAIRITTGFTGLLSCRNGCSHRAPSVSRAIARPVSTTAIPRKARSATARQALRRLRLCPYKVLALVRRLPPGEFNLRLRLFVAAFRHAGPAFAGEDVPRCVERLFARSVQYKAHQCAHGVLGQDDDASSSVFPERHRSENEARHVEMAPSAAADRFSSVVEVCKTRSVTWDVRCPLARPSSFFSS